MCDEYNDVANKEQLAFCLRWVYNNLELHGEFIGFYEIPDVKGVRIVSVIKDTLARYQESLDSCRGQCYDGYGQCYAWKIDRGCSTNTRTSVTRALHRLSRALAITISKGCDKNCQDFKGYNWHSRRDH